MKYFSDLEWVIHGYQPECRAVIDKTFDDYHLLAYAHRGSLPLGISKKSSRVTEKFRIQGPAAWLCFPGPHFHFGNAEEPWEHRYVGFRGKRVANFLKRGLIPLENHDDKSPPVFPIFDAEEFRRTFDALLAHLEKSPDNPRSVLLLEDLLLQIHEQSVLKKENPYRNLWMKIRNRPEMDWDFSSEAARLKVTVARFRKRYTEEIGEAPNQSLIRARLDLAAKLLQSTALKTGEIARQVGIEDLFYFSRLFKKHRRASPEHYRKESRLFTKDF